MKDYDDQLERDGRLNLSDLPGSLRKLGKAGFNDFFVIEFLWMHNKHKQMKNILEFSIAALSKRESEKQKNIKVKNESFELSEIDHLAKRLNALLEKT